MWYAVQWNYSKQDIIRAEESVLIREVSLFHIIVQEWYTICTLGRRMRGVLISEVEMYANVTIHIKCARICM